MKSVLVGAITSSLIATAALGQSCVETTPGTGGGAAPAETVDPINLLSNGSSMIVNRFGDCREVVNNTGADLMIPSSIGDEWNSGGLNFLSHLPTGVDANPCPAGAGGPGDWSMSVTDMLYEPAPFNSAESYFGQSEMTPDGATLFVGENGISNQMYQFNYTTCGYQHVDTLQSPNGLGLIPLAVSGDGNWLLVGAEHPRTSMSYLNGKMELHLFKKTGTQWSFAHTLSTSNWSYEAAAMNMDGTVVALHGQRDCFHDNNCSSERDQTNILRRPNVSSTAWSHQLTHAYESSGHGDFRIQDIAVSPDGNTVITSYWSIHTGPIHPSRLETFNYNGSGWTRQRISVGSPHMREGYGHLLHFVDNENVVAVPRKGHPLGSLFINYGPSLHWQEIYKISKTGSVWSVNTRIPVQTGSYVFAQLAYNPATGGWAFIPPDLANGTRKYGTVWAISEDGTKFFTTDTAGVATYNTSGGFGEVRICEIQASSYSCEAAAYTDGHNPENTSIHNFRHLYSYTQEEALVAVSGNLSIAAIAGNSVAVGGDLNAGAVLVITPQ